MIDLNSAPQTEVYYIFKHLSFDNFFYLSLRKIIEDQRRKNSSLEEKMLRKDQFHVNSRNHFIEEEYQNQIQRLKYDLHELNSKTNSEMEKLQRKLGYVFNFNFIPLFIFSFFLK